MSYRDQFTAIMNYRPYGAYLMYDAPGVYADMVNTLADLSCWCIDQIMSRRRNTVMSAGDFYYAINATFRHIHDTYGKDALIDYWTTMAHEYHAEIAERFREGGLEAVRDYWADYFAAEPDGDVYVTLTDQATEIDVRDCPAIRWLKAGGREIVPYYCEHCHYVSSAIAEQAGLAFGLTGGGGTCHQRFSPGEA